MSLTELSNYVRRAIPFVVLFGLVFLIIFYSFKLFFIYMDANKVQTLNINPTFGKIDYPKLTEATASAGFNFILDTVEGAPIVATSTANVYFQPDSPTRFGYREKILLIAKSLGFNTDQTSYKLNAREATFDDGSRKLIINIGNFNFTYASDIKTNTFVTGSISLPDTDIQNKAIDFLKLVGRYPDELAQGTTNVIYLKYDSVSGNFVNVERLLDASAVEVDFYRPSVNDIQMATPKFFNSQNYVIMNFKSDGTPNVIKSQIAFFEKSNEQFGIYPLKTGEQAWNQLKAGGGMVVAGREGVKDVTIKKMGLYYLDSDIYQTYLEPIYVFIGNNDFVAFVPAVSDDYINLQ